MKSDPALSFAELLTTRIIYDVHPPLYYSLQHWWLVLVGGGGETAWRSFSAVVGVVTVVAGAVLARPLLDRATRALFVGLLACSYGAIYYAQEARPYSLLLLFSTLLTLTATRLARYIQAREALPVKQQVLFVLAGIGAVYTHYFGVLLVAGTTAALLVPAVRCRAHRLRVLMLGTLVAVAFLPWIAVLVSVYEEVLRRNDTQWIRLDYVRVVHTFAVLVFGNYAARAVFVLAVLRALMGTPWRMMADDAAFYVPAVTIAVCAAAAVGLSQIVPIVVARYFIILLPALYLGMAWLIGRDQPPVILRVFTPLALSILLFGSLHGYYQPSKEQWRESAAFIRDQPGCESGTILVAGGPLAFFEYYFGHGRPGLLREVKEVWEGQFDPAVIFADSCPVALWAGHTDRQALSRLLDKLGWSERSWDIHDFIDTYAVLKPPPPSARP